MLTIRPEQLAVLDEVARERFMEWAAGHLRKWFGPEVADLDDEGLRDFIRHGLERAAAWGLTDDASAGKYLNVMAMFGRDFDVDPDQDWAAMILGDDSIHDPQERIGELAAAAVAMLPEH